MCHKYLRKYLFHICIAVQSNLAPFLKSNKRILNCNSNNVLVCNVKELDLLTQNLLSMDNYIQVASVCFHLHDNSNRIHRQAASYNNKSNNSQGMSHIHSQIYNYLLDRCNLLSHFQSYCSCTHKNCFLTIYKKRVGKQNSLLNYSQCMCLGSKRSEFIPLRCIRINMGN
jgi:hypothetical protein